MARTPPSARTAARRTRRVVLGLAGVVAAIAVVLGYLWPKPAPETSARAAPPGRTPTHAPSASSAPSPMESARPEHGGPLTAADGVVPDGTTVFDDSVPAVSQLDPALLKALRQAATDAGQRGVAFHVNSGWRSPEYQNHLLDEAVSKYGSEDEAARWVATAATSPHVSGDAVDLGRSDATAWLSAHGAAYGLCRIYKNEPWHYELRAEASEKGCPALYDDPTQDPRMQQ
ncbi:M15 family metallopeptidase [Streptomyces sp. NPDC052225]|uniref:M15 family metallopeptidase n=1 Tax=Streptomyces sp. NPDC052225 TaxID=3154949 RepID=UPI00342472CF